MTDAKAVSRRNIVTASIAAALGLLLLLSLGTWQLQRKAWKENLIATLTARIDQPPQALPPRAQWPALTEADSEYARVKFTATWLPGEAFVYTAGSSLRPDVTVQGYWVFAPARLADGAVVLVDRGFVPTGRKDAATRSQGTPAGPVEIVGYIRWPESRGLFAPEDDVKANVFFTRDPKTMAAANGWTVDAPFYIDQELPVPAGGLPKPGAIDVKLPNNHWQYALTWYGLALALLWVYGVWLAGRLRRR
ncbi:SURF1 family protein [Undibacter mobilis]|uniref:SURF1-like protein n=1 Tax=Undibacter mobilis TaxID=2292256 RepID=A0A371B7R7_9BRAD|nr:SURF1 family protein [Undibacter mobilis]RDV03646.1 SURF1 family protein [Undibacter mobilis]